MASGQNISEDHIQGERSVSELIYLTIENGKKREDALKEQLEYFQAKLQVIQQQFQVSAEGLRNIISSQASPETTQRKRRMAHILALVGAIILILGAIAAVSLAVFGSINNFTPQQLSAMIVGAAVAGVLITGGVGLGMGAIIILSQIQNNATTVESHGYTTSTDIQRHGYQPID